MVNYLYLLILLLFSENYSCQVDSIFSFKSRADTGERSFNIPMVNALGSEDDPDQQDASSLLQSSRDVFTQFASFQFGMAGYRQRGYHSEDHQVMINGIKLENPEGVNNSWSSWGGLNDVTRNIETHFGNSAARILFSGAGGYTNIDASASNFKKGTRISYANTNRLFRHRLMVTQSTGMMQNGLAMTISASFRQGDQVYRPGTFYKASAFYFSIEKRIRDLQTICFTAIVAPSQQGRSASETLETYALSKTNYYNSLWGFQHGKVRNTTVSKVQRPVLILNHTYKINISSRLSSAVFFSFGKSGLTALNWYNAVDPRPDYYRYLPSYYFDKGDSATGITIANKWLSDVNQRQINWDLLTSVNRANLFTLPSQIGQGINTSETRARYILENKIENLKHCILNVVYNKRRQNIFLSFGLYASIYKNRKYKEIEDLLGASYWLDYDMFAQNLGADPNLKQNNIEAPDKKLYKADRFGYDYTINVNCAEIWGQVEYEFKKMELYGSLTLSETEIWRKGFVANGKFPTSSSGSSDKIRFLNAGAKVGATYKFSGRHFITSNVMIRSGAPEVNNIFISPSTRNELVKNIEAERLLCADLNYFIKMHNLKLRFTVYYTQILNQIWNRIYYSDIYNTNVNLVMKNIDQSHQGLEFGLEKPLDTHHTFQMAIGYGQFIYTNRPKLEAWQDNNQTALFSDRTVYLKNYKTGESPQLVGGAGYKYTAGRNWFLGLNINYFDQIFIVANPDRRTEEALFSFFSNETEQYKKIISQEKLPAYYLMNANGGKTIRFFKKYTLAINLSVNNLLNNKNIIISGREQLRWDFSNIDKFSNKYNYMTGRTYMAMLNFSF